MTMRGSWLHNQVLVQRCVAAMRSAGAEVRTEVSVNGGRAGGYVDAFARIDGRILVVEAERSLRRLEDDCRKAQDLGAELLVIVLPTRSMADRAARLLRTGTGHRTHRMKLWILPLGTAIARLARIPSSLDESQPRSPQIKRDAKGTHP
jgi:hypothetical protein